MINLKISVSDFISWMMHKISSSLYPLCLSIQKKSPKLHLISALFHKISPALHKISANSSSEEQIALPFSSISDNKSAVLHIFSVKYPIFSLNSLKFHPKLLFRSELMHKISAKPDKKRANCTSEEENAEFLCKI